ncbi:hypothetical protein HDK64DRAFT_320609 [Phyllosticta capitalensis]
MDKFVTSWTPVAQWPDSYRITAAKAREIILMPATQEPFDQWQRVFEGFSSGRRLDSVSRETMISVAKRDRVMTIDQNPPKTWNAELMAGKLLYRLDEEELPSYEKAQINAARKDHPKRERGETFGLHNVDWEYDGLEDADGMDIDTPYDPNQPVAPDTNVHELNQQQTAIRDKLMSYPPVEKCDQLARDVLAAFQPVTPSDASSGLSNIWSKGSSLEEARKKLGIENKEPYHLPRTPRSQPLYYAAILDYPGCGKTRETLLSLEMVLTAAEGVKKPSLIVVPSAAAGEQWIGKGLACSNGLSFVAFGNGFAGKYQAEHGVHCIQLREIHDTHVEGDSFVFTCTKEIAGVEDLTYDYQ